MRLALVTPPAAPLLTVEEIKPHLRIEGPDDDVLLGDYIAVAADMIEGREGRTRKQFRTATYRYWPETMGRRVEIPLPPLQAVVSVDYTDGDGIAQVAPASGYTAIPDGYTGYIEGDWPKGTGHSITFTAGYSDPAMIPATIRQAVRLLVGHFYENREATTVGVQSYEIPHGVCDLLATHTVPGRYWGAE